MQEYFFEPTIFTDVGPDMRIAQEEIFGPVVSLIPVFFSIIAVSSRKRR